MRIENWVLVFGFWLLTTTTSATEFSAENGKLRFQYDSNLWEVVPPIPDSRKGEEVDRTMAQKTLVTIQKKAADEKYRSRFSVVTDDLKSIKMLPSEDALSAYQKHAIEFMKSQRFDILKTSSIRLSKISSPAIEIVANQRDFGLKFRQVILVHQGQAYMLTAAARTAKYESYEKELNKLFDSVELEAK